MQAKELVYSGCTRKNEWQRSKRSSATPQRERRSFMGQPLDGQNVLEQRLSASEKGFVARWSEAARRAGSSRVCRKAGRRVDGQVKSLQTPVRTVQLICSPTVPRQLSSDMVVGAASIPFLLHPHRRDRRNTTRDSTHTSKYCGKK